MTPDELRKEADPTRLATTHIDHTSKVMLAAADAWERMEHDLSAVSVEVNRQNVDLRQRLEAAEKVREAVKQDIANGHMRGTMPLTTAALAGEEKNYMDKYPGGYKEWEDLHGRQEP